MRGIVVDGNITRTHIILAATIPWLVIVLALYVTLNPTLNSVFAFESGVVQYDSLMYKPDDAHVLDIAAYSDKYGRWTYFSDAAFKAPVSRIVVTRIEDMRPNLSAEDSTVHYRRLYIRLSDMTFSTAYWTEVREARKDEFRQDWSEVPLTQEALRDWILAERLSLDYMTATQLSAVENTVLSGKIRTIDDLDEQLEIESENLGIQPPRGVMGFTGTTLPGRTSDWCKLITPIWIVICVIIWLIGSHRTYKRFK